MAVMFILSAIVPSLISAQEITEEPPAQLLINEIQTGGLDKSDPSITPLPEDGRIEFIELYNQGAAELDITGWKLQYFAATRDDVIDTSSVPTGNREVILDGTVANDSVILVSYQDFLPEADYYFTASTSSGWLAQSGGHLRIIDAEGTLVDTVGWGSAKQPETSAAVKPSAGTSIERALECDTSLPIDTNDNFYDFIENELPTPGEKSQTHHETCEQIPGEDLPPTEPQPSCEGIVLSELLPNAVGADNDKEFIEIHNPTNESIVLTGCGLRLNEDGKTFMLPNDTIEAGTYRAFYDTETGITLPNAAGGTVWIITPNEEWSVVYPPDMKEGQTWALIGDVWKTTLKPTPGAANQLVLPTPPTPPAPPTSNDSGLTPCAANQERNPDTNRCRLIRATTSSLTPCRADQERNPATNRCKAVRSATTSLIPCRIGQTRSSQTNRCRAVVSTASALTPCKSGQTRNPATNRCRSSAATNTLKPCATNQIRNPETNRCKLDASSSNTLGVTDVKDVATGPVASNPRWWLAGAAVLAATGYGAYEWRQEIKTRFGRLKDRFTSSASSH